MCHETETINFSIKKSCQDVSGKFEACFFYMPTATLSEYLNPFC